MGSASSFLDDLAQKETERRTRLRSSFTSKERHDLLSELKKSEQKEKRVAYRAKKKKERAKLIRDGYDVRCREIDGFAGRERIADGGKRKIVWGHEYEDIHTYHILTFREGVPLQHVKINLRVISAWVAEGCDRLIVEAELNRDYNENPRYLYLIFSEDGQLLKHFQMPLKFLNFLGFNESGTFYTWSYQGWLHITDIETGLDYQNIEMPGNFYPNVAEFDSHRHIIRLLAPGGTRLELCWEDKPHGHLKTLLNELTDAQPSDRAWMIKREWRSHPEPNEKLGNFLMPWLKTISRADLSEDGSWNKWKVGWLEFQRLRQEICKICGHEEQSIEASQEIEHYNQPYDTANGAHRAVRDAVATNNSENLLKWRDKLNDAINGGVLQRYPHFQAKCWRYLGEIEEAIGDTDKAIEFYDTAIQIDDGVGCKRRLKKLQKESR